MECSKCGISDDKRTLTKCPVCHKMICDECRCNVGGRYFCSNHCADFYFFDDEES